MILINFGCPRSGTTFAHYCMSALGKQATVIKLNEHHALHPVHSRTGLYDLARLFATERLILVRTVRHPMEIAESFLATRQHGDGSSGLARKSDDEIWRMVAEESTSVMVQRPLLEEVGVPLIEVRYEEFPGLADKLGAHLDTKPMAERLAYYRTESVREGRLLHGQDRVSTDAERAFFAMRLDPIARREGYDG